jgi:hypothetical protein
MTLDPCRRSAAFGVCPSAPNSAERRRVANAVISHLLSRSVPGGRRRHCKASSAFRKPRYRFGRISRDAEDRRRRVFPLTNPPPTRRVGDFAAFSMHQAKAIGDRPLGRIDPKSQLGSAGHFRSADVKGRAIKAAPADVRKPGRVPHPRGSATSVLNGIASLRLCKTSGPPPA